MYYNTVRSRYLGVPFGVRFRVRYDHTLQMETAGNRYTVEPYQVVQYGPRNIDIPVGVISNLVNRYAGTRRIVQNPAVPLE